jgi:hypothetical protein
VSVLSDRRVTRNGLDFHVSISHGLYLVEFDDRNGLWWAYDQDGLGLGGKGGTDPLACSSDACSGWDVPEGLISALLEFDGQAVPA